MSEEIRPQLLNAILSITDEQNILKEIILILQCSDMPCKHMIVIFLKCKSIGIYKGSSTEFVFLMVMIMTAVVGHSSSSRNCSNSSGRVVVLVKIIDMMMIMVMLFTIIIDDNTVIMSYTHC